METLGHIVLECRKYNVEKKQVLMNWQKCFLLLLCLDTVMISMT